MRRRTFALVIASSIALAPTAHAQGLRGTIDKLFTFGDCGEPLCLAGSVNAQNGHGNHFIPADVSGNSTVLSFLTNAIGLNVSNVPVSAASGGATFTFQNGLPVKTAESSGPIYGERAQTLGRHRTLVGVNFTGMNFSTLRGVPLHDIQLDFTHEDVGEPGLGDSPYENDFIQVRTSMDVHLLETSFFLTYGLSDRIDVGFVVPLAHVSVSGESVAEIVPFGTPVAHFFGGTPDDPVLSATSSASGSATGLGDISIRAKVNLNESPRSSFSLFGDVRLPTGREEDFLGSGAWAFRGLGVFSARFGAFTPHLNGGVFYHSGDTENDALLATAGFDQLMSSWATLSFDVISQWELGHSMLTIPPTVTIEQPYVRTIQPTNIPTGRDDIVNASLGLKMRMDSGATGIVNLILPVNHGGLRPNAIWTFGLEYNF
ncbi:MAG TPA: transporter [Gemmatimonadaceae bacterium]